MFLRHLNVARKRVLLRVDYNVALADGRVVEPKRLQATIPTLRYLLDKDAKLIILSHLGRPKGQRDSRYSLKVVAEHLKKILLDERVPHHRFIFSDSDFHAGDLARQAAGLGARDIMVLENLRFDPGEEKNDPRLAAALAPLGEVFVQEAFGALHRAHASTDQLPRMLPSVFGFLVEQELQTLQKLLASAAKPFVVLLGGVKVADKIGAIENLLKKGVDKILIGGAMSYTFLKAAGASIGNSLLQKEWVAPIARLLANPDFNARIVPCSDHWAIEGSLDASTGKFPAGAKPRLFSDRDIKAGWQALDIGPQTVAVFQKELTQAKTIFWNGPLGFIEEAPFDRGTTELAAVIARQTKAGALTVLGGGDTIYALSRAGFKESDCSHVSTGGGATLEFLEGKQLPGIVAIKQQHHASV